MSNRCGQEIPHFVQFYTSVEHSLDKISSEHCVVLHRGQSQKMDTEMYAVAQVRMSWDRHQT